jgi:hypothetical protein
MVNFLLLLLGVFSLVFQISAAYLAFKIYKFNRLSEWWLILLSAFELEAMRRFLVVVANMSVEAVSLMLVIDMTILFAVSLFTNIGLYSMLKNFENFDFIEKKSSEAAKNFNNSKKKSKK